MVHLAGECAHAAGEHVADAAQDGVVLCLHLMAPAGKRAIELTVLDEDDLFVGSHGDDRVGVEVLSWIQVNQRAAIVGPLYGLHGVLAATSEVRLFFILVKQSHNVLLLND